MAISSCFLVTPSLGKSSGLTASMRAAQAKHYLPEEDLAKFPYKVLQFGSLSQVPKELQKFARPESRSSYFSNLLQATFCKRSQQRACFD